MGCQVQVHCGCMWTVHLWYQYIHCVKQRRGENRGGMGSWWQAGHAESVWVMSLGRIVEETVTSSINQMCVEYTLCFRRSQQVCWFAGVTFYLYVSTSLEPTNKDKSFRIFLLLLPDHSPLTTWLNFRPFRLKVKVKKIVQMYQCTASVCQVGYIYGQQGYTQSCVWDYISPEVGRWTKEEPNMFRNQKLGLGRRFCSLWPLLA